MNKEIFTNALFSQMNQWQSQIMWCTPKWKQKERNAKAKVRSCFSWRTILLVQHILN